MKHGNTGGSPLQGLQPGKDDAEIVARLVAIMARPRHHAKVRMTSGGRLRICSVTEEVVS